MSYSIRLLYAIVFNFFIRTLLFCKMFSIRIKEDIFILYIILRLFVRRRNTKVIVIPSSFFMYIHHPARKFGHCLALRFRFPYLSLHLSFSFLSPPFLFALLAASFGGALCSMARRARAAARLPKIRFPS